MVAAMKLLDRIATYFEPRYLLPDHLAADLEKKPSDLGPRILDQVRRTPTVKPTTKSWPIDWRREGWMRDWDPVFDRDALERARAATKKYESRRTKRMI